MFIDSVNLNVPFDPIIGYVFMYSGDATNSFHMTSYHFFLAIFSPYKDLNGVLLIPEWNQKFFISIGMFFV